MNSQLALHNLRCEYQTNPVGIDVYRPRLSWALREEYMGVKQSAYRILVAESEAGLTENTGFIWDSGRIESDTSFHVPYAGTTLGSRQRCY